jgi:hypothetical protein
MKRNRTETSLNILGKSRVGHKLDCQCNVAFSGGHFGSTAEYMSEIDLVVVVAITVMDISALYSLLASGAASSKISYFKSSLFILPTSRVYFWETHFM